MITEPEKSDRRLFSPREVAAELRISIKTLRRHVELGNIGYVAVGSGLKHPRIAFLRVDIDKFIEHRRSHMPRRGPRPHTRIQWSLATHRGKD
jgi:hypothetical protein